MFNFGPLNNDVLNATGSAPSVEAYLLSTGFVVDSESKALASLLAPLSASMLLSAVFSSYFDKNFVLGEGFVFSESEGIAIRPLPIGASLSLSALLLPWQSQFLAQSELGIHSVQRDLWELHPKLGDAVKAGLSIGCAMEVRTTSVTFCSSFRPSAACFLCVARRRRHSPIRES